MAKRRSPKRLKYSRKQRHALLAGAAEPEWDDVTPDNLEHRLIVALNWYNYEKDNKHAIKYLIAFCKGRVVTHGDYIKAIKNIAGWKIPSTAGWLARMADQGAPLTDKSYKYIDSCLEKALREYNESSTTTDEPIKNKSVHQKIVDKAKEHIGDIEGELDDVILNDYTITFNSYEFMVGRDIKGKTAQIIAEHFEAVCNEYQAALKDKQAKKKTDLAEAYANYSQKELKKLTKLYEDVKTNAEQIVVNTAKKRKPKKLKTKKGKNPTKLVSRLKYLKTFDKLKLVSENPEKLIGAKAAFVYNTHTKTLALYVAKSAEGLTVSRSSLRNFIPEESGSKKIARQLKLLKTIQNTTKARAVKLFHESKSKINSSTGRINGNTIILKIFR